jgi:hypothetical protein
MVALSAGVAEAVPTSPFLPTRESEPSCHVCLSAVCRTHDRVPSGAGCFSHSMKY